MRISDWSSDVCSSDLDAAGHRLDQVFDVALLLRPIRRVIGARRIHGSESRRVDVRRRDDTVQLENPAHHRPDAVRPEEIGRAHVWTPVPNAHLVCRLLLEKQKNIRKTPTNTLSKIKHVETQLGER